MPVSPSGEQAETAIESASAPPDPFAALTEASSAHVSHELGEPYSASTLHPVSTAFDEGDIPLDIPPMSAPVPSASVPINASDIQVQQHTVLTGSPPMLPTHRVDAEIPAEAPLPSIAPYDPPADMEFVDAASLSSSDTAIQRPSSPSHLIPQNAPPSDVLFLTGSPYTSAPPLPPQPSAPPLPPSPSASYVQIPRPPPPPPEPSPPPELTPGLIAKAQKHCRFAISALDYEDMQQARKELHAALAILGR